MNPLVENIQIEFKARFPEKPVLIYSPGRVNLIGEHTDYNDGFVLPAAIDKRIILAMAPNGTDKIRLFATDMNKKSYETNLSKELEKSGLRWPDYVLGVIDQLRKRGKIIEGFDCLFGGDIPIGAGLSSSAALEGGVLAGLDHIFNLQISRVEMAEIGQQAENQFVGVQCGIMDQFTNQLGKSESAIKLDCRSLEYTHYPFDRDDVSILLFDTKVRRELATSEYNVRRRQCEQGVKILKRHDSSIHNLRDVENDMLEQYKNELPELVYNRCRYVLDENRRVLEACRNLTDGDIHSFGRQMYNSHYGLRDLYEVSCRELDVLVEATESLDGVLGSRMMGGGFGGCTINLVLEAEVEPIANRIKEYYINTLGKPVDYYVAKIGKGTSVLENIEL